MSSYDRCAHKFCCRFPHATVPSIKCVTKLCRKWHEISCLKQKEKPKECSFDRYLGKNTEKSKKLFMPISTRMRHLKDISLNSTQNAALSFK